MEMEKQQPPNILDIVKSNVGIFGGLIKSKKLTSTMVVATACLIYQEFLFAVISVGVYVVSQSMVELFATKNGH